MAFKFNPFTGTLDIVSGSDFWKDPVADASSLPTSGNSDGDARVTQDTGYVWVWEDTASRWIQQTMSAGSAIGSTPNTAGYSISTDDSTADLRRFEITLQPADASNPGIVSTAAQTFAGDKTFNGTIFTEGGIDVAETAGTDTLLIGATNADVITIGNSTTTVNFNGTVNNNNVTNLNVTDKLITVNDGGGAASGNDSGIEIEENATITGFFKTSADRNSWRVKAPNTSGEVLLTPGTSTVQIQGGATTPSSTTADSIHSDNDVAIYSNDDAVADANPAGDVLVEGGNKTAGTGNGGNVRISAGTSTGGEDGDAFLTSRLFIIDSTSTSSPSSVFAVVTTPRNQGVANLDTDNIVYETGRIRDAGSYGDSGDFILRTGEVRQGGGDLTNTSNTGNITIESGRVRSDALSGTLANTGSVSFRSGRNDEVGNTGSVTVQSGNAASGDSGTVFINAGTASGTRGGVQIDGNVVDVLSDANLIFAHGAGSSIFVRSASDIYGSFRAEVGPDEFIIQSNSPATGNTALILQSNSDASSGTSPTGNVQINTGNVPSGAVDSGDILLTTGSVDTGTRGDIVLDGEQVDVSTSKVVNVVDPTAAQDAATKNYVDTEITSAGHANDTLNNLGVTAVNADIIPDSNNTRQLGNTANKWSTVTTTQGFFGGSEDIRIAAGLQMPSGNFVDVVRGNNVAEDLGFHTVNSGSTATGNVRLETGNSTVSNSGDIILQTGTASGTRGDIVLNGLEIDASTSKIINVVDPTNDQDAATKIYVDNNTLASSSGDIEEDSFSLTNNQASAADVTGFAFAVGTVRSFWAEVSVTIDATADLYETFIITGINKATSWDINIESLGDDSLVDFTITNAGQIQYTSGNYAGFSSGTVKFRALVTTV